MILCDAGCTFVQPCVSRATCQKVSMTLGSIRLRNHNKDHKTLNTALLLRSLFDTLYQYTMTPDDEEVCKVLSRRMIIITPCESVF